VAYGKFVLPRTELQRLVSLKEPKAREWLKKNLDGTESFGVLRDPSGLGFRVAIRSIRARDLFLNLHADVLPGFNDPRPWLEDGVWSVLFGYGGPFHPSVHYLSMQ
jgi:hypothetical protein